MLLQPYHCISITTICNFFLFPTTTTSTSSATPPPPRLISRSYAALLLQHALVRYHQPQQAPNASSATATRMMVTTCRAVASTVSTTLDHTDTVPCTGTSLPCCTSSNEPHRPDDISQSHTFPLSLYILLSWLMYHTQSFNYEPQHPKVGARWTMSIRWWSQRHY